jgi:hypothetical protein
LEQPTTVDILGSELNNKEVLALAWAAIQDKDIFPSSQDTEDRQWGLLEALANIQRAHNEDEDGVINWDPEQLREDPNTGALVPDTDQVSCEVGKFKRLLEHLDGIHPDVRFNSETIPSQMVIQAIHDEHLNLAKEIPLSDRQQIAESFHNPADQGLYLAYVQRLKERVHSIHSRIPLESLDSHLDADMMESLFNLKKWDPTAVQEPAPTPIFRIVEMERQVWLVDLQLRVIEHILWRLQY